MYCDLDGSVIVVGIGIGDTCVDVDGLLTFVEALCEYCHHICTVTNCFCQSKNTGTKLICHTVLRLSEKISDDLCVIFLSRSTANRVPKHAPSKEALVFR